MNLVQSWMLCTALVIAPGYVYTLPVQLPKAVLVNKIIPDVDLDDLINENSVQQLEGLPESKDKGKIAHFM